MNNALSKCPTLTILYMREFYFFSAPVVLKSLTSYVWLLGMMFLNVQRRQVGIW